MKSSSLFILTLVMISLLWSFHSSGNIFDEDEQQNSIDQLSLNQVGQELQDLDKDDNLSKVYLPAKTEDISETKVAESEEENQNSDEVKLKEAAVMKDLEKPAKTKPLRERSR